MWREKRLCRPLKYSSPSPSRLLEAVLWEPGGSRRRYLPMSRVVYFLSKMKFLTGVSTPEFTTGMGTLTTAG